MVKTSLSNAGGGKSIPGQGTYILHASKSQNISNFVTNSIKLWKKKASVDVNANQGWILNCNNQKILR